MKNLFNKFATVLLAVTFIFAFASCEKEEVEPDVPQSTTTTTSGGTSTTTDTDGNTTVVTTSVDSNGDTVTTTTITDSDGNVVSVTSTTTTNNTTTTNTSPTIDATIALTGSNSIDVYSFTNDVDNDNITLVSITGETNGSVSVSGSNITYTPTNALWVGTETLAVTVNDGTVDVTSNVTLTYGSSAQIATYNLIAPYFGNRFDGNIDDLILNSNGTLTSLKVASFYGDHNANSGNYEILSNGKIRVDVEGNGTLYREWVVTEFVRFDKKGLTFTGKTMLNDMELVLNVWNG
jgi:hypothetical protein